MSKSTLLDSIDIQDVIAIAKQAGDAIMDVYATDFDVEYKDDESPLTLADQKANDIIKKGVLALNADIPYVSEEDTIPDYEIRKNWEYNWLVDPLDGTKEFVKKTGEFTVNIALIHQQAPVLGVVYAPALDTYWYGKQGEPAYKQKQGAVTQIHARKHQQGEKLIVVGSKSHGNEALQDYLKQYDDYELVSMGSSIKICLVAEGKAHIYPRLAPTSEWDTAAAHAVVVSAGAQIQDAETEHVLGYNKQSILNSKFKVTATQSLVEEGI